MLKDFCLKKKRIHLHGEMYVFVEIIMCNLMLRKHGIVAGNFFTPRYLTNSVILYCFPFQIVMKNHHVYEAPCMTPYSSLTNKCSCAHILLWLLVLMRKANFHLWLLWVSAYNPVMTSRAKWRVQKYYHRPLIRRKGGLLLMGLHQTYLLEVRAGGCKIP